MACRSQHLAAYLEGTSMPASAPVQQHLLHCPRCREIAVGAAAALRQQPAARIRPR